MTAIEIVDFCKNLKKGDEISIEHETVSSKSLIKDTGYFDRIISSGTIERSMIVIDIPSDSPVGISVFTIKNVRRSLVVERSDKINKILSKINHQN